MNVFSILDLVKGLALFLFGMHIMGGGLSKIAGGKLETILEKLTSKRLYAVLLGTAVTAVIQSSSATTVMVVGFVNSGIMSLKQSVGIIMGANVGTTITSWMLSLTGIETGSFWLRMLKPSSFSPILAAIGIIFVMSSKQESKKKDIGWILLGFTILMTGMELMSASVSGLSNNPTFTSLMMAFSNPLIGMIVGAILTAVIQSSSASVGILQALCSTGVVKYSVALPIIMGQNIGTCVTSLISSVGASKNAKRASLIHLYFNLIGTCVFVVVFYSINAIIHFTFLNASVNAADIAIIHSLFNIGATILLFPFSDWIVKLAEKTIPDTDAMEVVEKKMVVMDERFIDSPAFAMEICRNKAREMAQVTESAVTLATSLLRKYDAKQYQEVVEIESSVDQYEDALGSYLVKLSSKDLSIHDSHSMSIILHSISDLERISDHALQIANSAKEIHDKRLSFTSKAKKEIETLSFAVLDICNIMVDSFCQDDDQLAMHVEPLEQVIDVLTMKVKENHIVRLQKGQCTIEMGFVLEDVLNALERISDHCSNVAIEMITIFDNGYNTHEYFKELPQQEREKFDEEFNNLLKKYPINKQDAMIEE